MLPAGLSPPLSILRLASPGISISGIDCAELLRDFAVSRQGLQAPETPGNFCENPPYGSVCGTPTPRKERGAGCARVVTRLPDSKRSCPCPRRL
jgi:hypothetical protein